MKTTSLKLPPALKARVLAAANARGESRSEIMREALERYLARGGGTARSFLAEASDLAGALSGPTDLSCDPRHLESYGK